MEQFNNLIEFRQDAYEHGFAKVRDAQFEIVDALLLGQPIRSSPELSLLPVFRRQWTLADRQYVFSPTPAVDGGSIVVGHPCSVLAWIPEPGSISALLAELPATS